MEKTPLFTRFCLSAGLIMASSLAAEETAAPEAAKLPDQVVLPHVPVPKQPVTKSVWEEVAKGAVPVFEEEKEAEEEQFAAVPEELPNQKVDKMEEEIEMAAIPDKSEKEVFDVEREYEALPPKEMDQQKICIKSITVKNGNNTALFSSDKDFPGDIEAFKQMLTERYLGKCIDQETVLQIKKDIANYFIENNTPFVVVLIPKQDISEGDLQFIVIESRVGTIKATGNKWFWDSQLTRLLDLKAGDRIREDYVSNSVDWMNRNPFHRTQVIFTPGSQPGTTDINLNTVDRFPVRFYVGGDNTGNNFTGNGRFYAGVNWGNAFFINDLFTYQYTCSNEFHRFQSHYANYTSFLPWRHMLVVYGGYSKIHPDINDFRSDGRFYQASGRYQIPFEKYGRQLDQEFSFGFDFKNTNSDLFFVGTTSDVPLVTKNVNLSQFMAEYSLEDNSPANKLSFDAQVVFSPAKMLPHETIEDYNSLRPHAKPRYVYGQLEFGDVAQMPGAFAFSTLLRMQGASGPLLPSEMFGLGGYDTVRGYDERVFLADNAFCANVEFHAPPLSMMKKKRDELTFLIFGDYGIGYNYKPFETEKKLQQLISVGPGLRYRIAPYLSARVDWGFQLKHVQFATRNFGKLHVGLTASY